MLHGTPQVSFELFDRREKRGPRRAGAGGVAQDPFVTVTNRRALLVNSSATAALGTPSRVLLYFDPGRRLAALRTADEDDPRAYAATRRGHGGRQLSIAVALFVAHHRIAEGKYWASMEDGMLVFGVGPAC